MSVVEAPSRRSIRTFVADRRAMLEQAQAAGSLARTKLDLKDEAEVKLFAAHMEEDRSRLRVMLEEEVEAFCADLRMASVTVQHQVERRKRRTARAIGAAVGAFAITVVALELAGVQSGEVGFGLSFVAAVIAFFLVW